MLPDMTDCSVTLGQPILQTCVDLLRQDQDTTILLLGFCC